ncbi:Anaphase-promoting complex subunit 11 [Trachymyrmex septentrionalis]|uniref:Anaphase-promoting complex subunit 11 n=1 Tax=Trachymyrmex septentrionalis TaxID=34720 RepID=A0A195F767_9HYME|nr:Anaphase-promoting complex subunit 11 [Trachymyrmex septentrionalis]
MKVTIKSWTGVATWRWIANDDNCGICRMPFDASCPDCKIPGDDCPLDTSTESFFSSSIMKRKALYFRLVKYRQNEKAASATARDVISIDACRSADGETRLVGAAVPHPRPVHPRVSMCGECVHARPVGAVLALFPYTLHHEVAALAADQPHMPDVSPGVEV